MKIFWTLLFALVAACLVPPAARAAEYRGVEFSGSGFLTVAAGKILGGTHDTDADLGYRCPCFISDYAQGGVYQRGRAQFGPDSKLGLQGTASIDNGRFSVTGQLISRGAHDGNVNVEWLYGTVELNSRWTLQVGRKRLPLFIYSEVQDVGFATPWVHLPPQLYGWEVVNFNGASLTYRDQWGSWLATVTTFAGDETAPKSGYWKIYNGKDSRTDTRWSNIVGAEARFGRGWFETRLMYLQSSTQNKVVSDGDTEYSPKALQRISGISFSADFGNWFGRAEFLHINRKADYGGDHAQLLAVGYRIGKFTPLLSYSNYRQSINFDNPTPAEAHDTRSAVLRYDVDRSSAVKLQLDVWRDRSAPGFQSMHGNSRLLSVSYDRVF